jgi:hypothetical protein
VSPLGEVSGVARVRCDARLVAIAG